MAAGTSVPVIAPNATLTTARLTLRAMRMQDAPHMLAAVQSEAFPRQLPMAQRASVEEFEEVIRRRWSRWNRGDGYDFSIDSTSDNALVGGAQIVREAESGEWMLGFWIVPHAWGKGYAVEAAGAVVRFAFEHALTDAIWAGAAVWNRPSQHVLEKLGFEFRERNPSGYVINGTAVATREYCLTHERWSAS